MEDTKQDKPQPRAISVRESTYQIITAEARRLGISRAVLVRFAVESFINKGKAKETRNDVA
jgi:hypothetical protein